MRLLTKSDFANLRKGSRFYVSDILIFYVKKNGCGNSRLGVAVSKKFGKAVRRNKVKRKIREFFRLNKYGHKDYDILISLNLKKILREKLPPSEVINRIESSLKYAFSADFKR